MPVLSFPSYYKYVLLVLGVVLSCSNNSAAGVRYKAKGASARHIDSMYYFHPVSSIGYVPDGNLITRNDSCSLLNGDILCNVFESNRAAMHIGGKIEITDTSLDRSVFYEILRLFDSAIKKVYFEQSYQSSVLDSIMDAGGKRFALIMLSHGYVRSAKSLKDFNREFRKRMFLNPPIWGFNTQPFDRNMADGTNSSTIFAMIIDAKENRTYFFNSDTEIAHPLNFSDLRSQLRTVFQTLFFSRPSLERS